MTESAPSTVQYFILIFFAQFVNHNDLEKI